MVGLGFGGILGASEMKCSVVIPVGPGHEDIYKRACDSVALATKVTPDVEVKLVLIDDLKGEKGRSRARNMGVQQARDNGSNWIFFLDADDLMDSQAFKYLEDYRSGYDAIFGNIWEMQNSCALWRYQITEMDHDFDLLSVDPFVSLQMGHFVCTDAAIETPFNEDMNTAEDFDYYIRLWEEFDCIKIPERLFINDRTRRSTGPRSATGAQWREAVSDVFMKYREKRKRLSEGTA
jgi:hypothetical protein